MFEKVIDANLLLDMGAKLQKLFWHCLACLSKNIHKLS
jgi:hypothetical protein